MKDSRHVVCLLLAAVIVLVPSIARANDPPTKIFVVGSGNGCPTATFSRIQDAIDQVPAGSQIRICAGIYPESIVITKDLTLRADMGAILMPSSVPANIASLSLGNPLAPIVFAQSADNVVIESLTIDGSAVPITQCAPDLIGVLYQNASGTVKRSTIQNVKLVPSLGGCQSGLGVFIQSGGGGASNVLVSENQIYGFQKNGITANEIGTSVRVVDNTVTGLGPTTGTAQNGIQIGYGAQGQISHNFVANDVWSPCVSASQCQWFATGILVEQSNGVRIEKNYVGGNQVNILVNGDDASLELNDVYGSIALEGIQILGNGVLLKANRIVDSSEYAVSVHGNNVGVIDNDIVNAPIGIFKLNTATGFFQCGNSFHDVGQNFVDPAPVGAGAVSYIPYR